MSCLVQPIQKSKLGARSTMRFLAIVYFTLLAAGNPIDLPIWIIDYEGPTYLINITIGTPPQKIFAMFDLSAVETVVVTGGTIAGLPVFNPLSSSTFRITGESNSDSAGAQGSHAIDNFHLDSTFLDGVDFQEVGSNATWHLDTYLGLGIGSSILANLSDSDANITSSGAYSIWFDKGGVTGHVLIGGINKAKFTPPLNTYYTISTDNTMSIILQSVSVAPGTGVGTSITVGQYAAIDFAFFTSLPEQVATQIWDSLGAQYDWNSNATSMIPIVPCSYKENTSKITFEFQDHYSGYSNIAYVEVKDLIIQNGTGPYYDEGPYAAACTLTINAVGPLDSIYIGGVVMKSLYTVFDTTNRVLSLATANSSLDSDNIVQIPYSGITYLYSSPTTFSSGSFLPLMRGP